MKLSRIIRSAGTNAGVLPGLVNQYSPSAASRFLPGLSNGGYGKLPYSRTSAHGLGPVVAATSNWMPVNSPDMEASSFWIPVACSNVTLSPRKVGESGFLFDPCRTGTLADASPIAERTNSGQKD
jgi:hypothetical protein